MKPPMLKTADLRNINLIEIVKGDVKSVLYKTAYSNPQKTFKVSTSKNLKADSYSVNNSNIKIDKNGINAGNKKVINPITQLLNVGVLIC